MPSREVIDAVLKDLFGQLPGLVVEAVSLEGGAPEGAADVRVKIVGKGDVICSISADGRLQSARVIGG